MAGATPHHTPDQRLGLGKMEIRWVTANVFRELEYGPITHPTTMVLHFPFTLLLCQTCLFKISPLEMPSDASIKIIFKFFSYYSILIKIPNHFMINSLSLYGQCLEHNRQ